MWTRDYWGKPGRTRHPRGDDGPQRPRSAVSVSDWSFAVSRDMRSDDRGILLATRRVGLVGGTHLALYHTLEPLGREAAGNTRVLRGHRRPPRDPAHPGHTGRVIPGPQRRSESLVWRGGCVVARTRLVGLTGCTVPCPSFWVAGIGFGSVSY